MACTHGMREHRCNGASSSAATRAALQGVQRCVQLAACAHSHLLLWNVPLMRLKWALIGSRRLPPVSRSASPSESVVRPEGGGCMAARALLPPLGAVAAGSLMAPGRLYLLLLLVRKDRGRSERVCCNRHRHTAPDTAAPLGETWRMTNRHGAWRLPFAIATSTVCYH